MKVFPHVFHMDIKKLRQSKNWSQQQMADNTGIPKDRIAKWEQGKGSPKLEDHIILQRFFDDLSLVAEEEIPLEKTAKVILGHGSIKSTRIYYHQQTSTIDAAMDKLNGL